MEKEKAEVEKRIAKILKFIQTKNKIPKEAKKEIVGLINDLHEHCQLLYSSFDDWQERSDSTTHGRKGKGKGKGKQHGDSSSSSSDWEYYSSEENDSNTGNVNEAAADGNLSFKEEIESAEFKRKLQELKSEASEREKELSNRVKELERQLGDAKAEFRAQEKQTVMRVGEVQKLGERNKGLHTQISGLELVLREKGDEISTLVNKFGQTEVRLTARIEDLKRQVSNLQKETDFLRAQNLELAGNIEGKRNEDYDDWMDRVNVMKHELAALNAEKKELKSQLAKKTNEVSEIQVRLKKREEEETEERVKGDLKKNKEEDEEEQEAIISRLTAKIDDQENLIKEQKEAIEKLSEDQKLVKRLSFGSTPHPKLNPNLLERKMEELAEDFRMKMEDHIRILYRRIHVAEQIHLETKNIYNTQMRQNSGSAGNGGNLDTQFKKLKEMLKHGMDGSTAIKKLEEEAREQMNRMARIGKEIDSARIWMREKKKKEEEMKHEIETLEAKLECREAQDGLTREKMSKLEAKLAEQGTEKLRIEKVMIILEKKIKELEMEIMTLGEEKKEAIRQLCVHVEYQRSRYLDLKRSIHL